MERNPSQAVCLQGSVTMAPDYTTEMPYVLDQGCVTFRGVSIINFKNDGGWFGDRPIISYHDQIEIVKALNDAYQKGYTVGFKSPKWL